MARIYQPPLTLKIPHHHQLVLILQLLYTIGNQTAPSLSIISLYLCTCLGPFRDLDLWLVTAWILASTTLGQTVLSSSHASHWPQEDQLFFDIQSTPCLSSVLPAGSKLKSAHHSRVLLHTCPPAWCSLAFMPLPILSIWLNSAYPPWLESEATFSVKPLFHLHFPHWGTVT